MRLLKEALDLAYAVLLAVGLMGGVWGAVYFLFGSHGLAARFTGASVFEAGLGSTGLIPMVLLVVVLAIVFLPKLQSSRPAGALLGGVVLGGYAFLYRVLTVGV